VKKALAIVLVLIGLTGCGQSGIAAQFGKTKITQTEVQKSIDEILLERTKFDTSTMQLISGEELNRNVLRFDLISEVFLQIANNQGLKITKGQIDSTRADLIAQVGGEASLPAALVNANIAPRDFDKYIRTVIISNSLSDAITQTKIGDPGTVIQQLIQDQIQSSGLKVNPRYGKWDFQAGDLTSFNPAGSALVK
jgi:sulfur carrier protein ThiS